MTNEQKEEPPGRQGPRGAWPSRRKCAVDSSKDGRAWVAALLAEHELVTVPEGFHTCHQGLTHIYWAPIGKALTPGESE